VNIKYLVLLISSLTVTAQCRAEQDSAAGHVDPYAPISPWAICPPQPDRDYDIRFSGDIEAEPTHLEGHVAERFGDGRLKLFGDAQVLRGDQRLRAARIIYDENTETVEADGDVIYDEPLLNITGTDGKFWLDQNRGELFGTQFRFYERHGRGDARKAYVLEPGVTRFKKVKYTTCPDGSNTWGVRATKVELDTNTGVGEAHDARLTIKDVPVLYTPYLSFPIDDRRKTGLLIPSFGSSDNSGFELKTPFYWNIAPNYDATITPRYLSDRGTQINTDFRFLQSKQEGSVRLEYLDKDDTTGDRRTRFSVVDNLRFSRNLTAKVDYDRVSDKDYLTDLGDSLSLASITYLRRTASVNYTTNWWRSSIQVDDYQTVDDTIAEQNRPYQRLPRLTFDAVTPPNSLGLESQWLSEAVRFDANKRVTADRLDLWPSVSWPYRATAFDVTPKLGFRYTAYELDDQPAGEPSNPTRSVPVFSLDNNLYLERDLSLAGRSYTQTLEPRLFYLYAKGDNQEDLPLFDSSEPTFSYRELFEENRFNGADRMGDANQAALALTTRLIDPNTGAEKLRASIGQLYYFANRNVTLNDTAPQTESESNIASELELALSRSWTGKADLIWDTHDSNTSRANARIQYHPGFRKIANLSYRYLNGEQNQVDASVLWPLSPAWHVVGRWYYDIGDRQKLETLAGIEYDSCCWGLRFVVRDYVDSTSKANNRVYMAQIVLKGLATFGSKIESVLEDGILGYSERPAD
jgi:LPS-assembly protein